VTAAAVVCARPGCESPIVQPATGRRRKHCSPACRQAAYRERRRCGRLEPFVAAGLVRSNGHGPELADPEVSFAFDPAPHRTFQVGENDPQLVGVPWFECWLADLGYDLRNGSPLDGAPLNLPRGPQQAAAA
jgi:hypothetical protein